MKIGIAGTGRMGTAIARRLLELGHEVQVWNRTADNAHDAREAGARWTPTLGELVSDSEVVISFLFDNAAVERVYLGSNGLVSGPVERRLFIDMSTVSPGTHDRIAPEITSRNGSFIECPVSGSIPTARSGALVGFAGGEAPAFARAQPLLQQLCRRIEHVGPLGAGARMKLAANLLLAVFWQALGEALLLTDRSAMDAARAIDLLADSNIGAAILRTRASEIVAAMNGDASGAAAFDVDTMRKDLRYMAQEATVHGSSLPLANRTLECFDRASHEGGGGVDGVAYPAYWIARQQAMANGGPQPAEHGIQEGT
ncbi:MAG TPA: NAD(P)-dependent oxidoreductase [Casimicrobiaceae bacterium]|jgi:3-hydroxyisobutyrate dehydrogenase|nr:NAD(P)-dependent oxidoreductase [Casimicrobiaceae bacterium]